jgi:hypothetical protein
MADELWIEIPNWDRFQHYKDRDPPWIKNYTRLLNDPDYLRLTPQTALILHRLWLDYARNNRSSRADDTANLSRRLGLRVMKYHLQALSDAGFIRISASKPLAPRYPDASEMLALARARERADARSQETETDIPLTPPPEGMVNCRKCGEPIKPGRPCWHCGATSRAAGSNPRALAARARSEVYDELLARAWQVAAGWNGGQSDTFDERLDELEREYGAHLKATDRLRLWDGARTGL